MARRRAVRACCGSLAPAIARWVSLPPRHRPTGSSCPPATSSALRLIARRTWRFFETFVAADDHALPPDNFQDDPQPVVAHRTSPTNIGDVPARDRRRPATSAGSAPLDMVERLEATLATIDELERFRGHLYNWYDTRDLRPLRAEYVSTVDSGNLAGHLLALANACRR